MTTVVVAQFKTALFGCGSVIDSRDDCRTALFNLGLKALYGCREVGDALLDDQVGFLRKGMVNA